MEAPFFKVSPNVYPGRSCEAASPCSAPAAGCAFGVALRRGTLPMSTRLQKTPTTTMPTAYTVKSWEYGMMWSRPEVAAIQAATSRAVIPPTTPNAFCVFSP